MKWLATLIIALGVLTILGMAAIKATEKCIKSVDPLAQQIMMLDRSKSLDVQEHKGELMQSLIREYYNFKVVENDHK